MSTRHRFIAVDKEGIARSLEDCVSFRFEVSDFKVVSRIPFHPGIIAPLGYNRIILGWHNVNLIAAGKKNEKLPMD